MDKQESELENEKAGKSTSLSSDSELENEKAGSSSNTPSQTSSLSTDSDNYNPPPFKRSRQDILREEYQNNYRLVRELEESSSKSAKNVEKVIKSLKKPLLLFTCRIVREVSKAKVNEATIRNRKALEFLNENRENFCFSVRQQMSSAHLREKLLTLVAVDGGKLFNKILLAVDGRDGN